MHDVGLAIMPRNKKREITVLENVCATHHSYVWVMSTCEQIIACKARLRMLELNFYHYVYMLPMSLQGHALHVATRARRASMKFCAGKA